MNSVFFILFIYCVSVILILNFYITFISINYYLFSLLYTININFIICQFYHVYPINKFFLH